MLRLLVKPCVAAISVLGVVGGCVSYEPTDLSFVSVTREPESTDKFLGLDFVTVTFTTHTNLNWFFGGRWVSLGVKGNFCGTRDDRTVSLFDADVYVNGKRLPPWRGESLLPPALTTAPYSYQVRLFVARPEVARLEPLSTHAEILHLNPPLLGFDLRREPKDACFYLGGGYMDNRFRSNTVVVPRAAIEAALQAPVRSSPVP